MDQIILAILEDESWLVIVDVHEVKHAVHGPFKGLS